MFRKIKEYSETLVPTTILFISAFYIFAKNHYQVEQNTHKIAIMEARLDALKAEIDKTEDDMFNNYVDKNYFWRDQNIVKNDFNTMSTNIMENAKIINNVAGRVAEINEVIHGH